MRDGPGDPVTALKRLLDEVSRVVVGQPALVEGLLVGLLAGGHVLVEGVPGLAKTTAIRTLAQALGLGFRRVQFTPDLLPGDLLGTPVYHPDERRFAVRKGPVFAPVLLADEINRAPAKVQSALLEAMEERQVTIGDESFPLPEPFFVMATQNPIEHEGTYPLPEAQVDRFLAKLVVGYPGADDERAIAVREPPSRPRRTSRPSSGPPRRCTSRTRSPTTRCAWCARRVSAKASRSALRPARAASCCARGARARCSTAATSCRRST
jgi:MoxR-like ATPase